MSRGLTKASGFGIYHNKVGSIAVHSSPFLIRSSVLHAFYH